MQEEIMSYDYAHERKYIFTEDGIKQMLSIRDRASDLLEDSGAAMLWSLMLGETGGSFEILACIDYLVETGFLCEIKYECRAQDRIFIRGEK
jgi:hypothetical protein